MEKSVNDLLKKIPAIDTLLKWEILQQAASSISAKFQVALLRKVVAAVRAEILAHPEKFHNSQKVEQLIARRIKLSLSAIINPSIKRVINCTGIILHTGLGRAPISSKAVQQAKSIIDGYCNLEFDLKTSSRGERTEHVEQLLCLLTGAEAAAVVNNNAAAVLLALNSLADGQEVAISRGELIEIGGSFRIPDVMRKSGAIMREVGTTNKTHAHDFLHAINDKSAGILSVHTSNYRIKGFTSSVALAELVKIAHENGLFLLHDLGGGILLDFEALGLPYEPMVADSIKAGVDVATFSGDKVIGGPQCGIIVGKKKLLERIRKNPLMRALRCDKLTFAVLESTLKMFISDDKTASDNTVIQQLTASAEDIKNRASQVKETLDKNDLGDIECSIEATAAEAGSGTLPVEHLASFAIVISRLSDAQKIARALADANPAIVGYVKQNKLFLDMRSCLPQDIDSLTNILISTLKRI